jgi:hypothetical protein
MEPKRSATNSGGTDATSVPKATGSYQPRTIGEWIGVGLVLAMFAMMGGIGALTIIEGVGQLTSGADSIPKALLVIAVGLVFSAVGFGFFYFRYVKQPLWDAEKRRLEARYPGEPWMLRKDWAARRIVHSNLGVTLLLWFWNIGWWGALAFIGTVNRDKILAALDESWWGYLLAALFVLCGLAALRLAIASTWAHWRYGRTVLRLDTLPAYIGDRFRGTVEAKLSARPTAGFKASLVCDRLEWVRTRRDGKTTSNLNVQQLARIDREIPASLVLVSRQSARIPVEIDIPPGSKGYDINSEGNGIRWTLHVEAPDVAGSPFSSSFEVPIYAWRA